MTKSESLMCIMGCSTLYRSSIKGKHTRSDLLWLQKGMVSRVERTNSNMYCSCDINCYWPKKV